MIPLNFGNTSDGVLCLDGVGNGWSGLCVVNDETQVGAMNGKIMTAQFDLKTWSLKSLTFGNRSLHAYHGEYIQHFENLRGKMKPFSNSVLT